MFFRGIRTFHSSRLLLSDRLSKLLLQKTQHVIAHDGSIRCTVLDGMGNVTNRISDIKRHDLISKYGLLPRDLRKLEKARSNNELVPSILVRDKSIIVSLLHIRAMITHNQVVLFDSMGGDSRTHGQLLLSLESRLKNFQGEDPLPYEFRAMESILISVVQGLAAEMKVHLTMTKGILSDLEYNITRDKLRYLLIQNKKLSAFFKKSILIRDTIEDVLEDDWALCDMYLSDKAKGIERKTQDHTEVEMILETYYQQCDEIVQTVKRMRSSVKTTEEIINIVLDSNRNQLMLLGLRFSIGLLSFGSAMFIASLYGMNLENFIEEGDVGFALVIIVSLLSMAGLFGYSLKELHKLQRITLMGSKRRR